MSSTNIQQYLICPITLELFNDPVLAQDGNTYERNAITDWITQHGTSPITKKPLSTKQLTLNRTIKDAVTAFKQQQDTHIAHTNVYDENRQSMENLDVLCLSCGLPQKLNTIREHKSRCSSKSADIETFEIADNEAIFTISQQTSSKNTPSRDGKTNSFHNPLAHRTANSTTNQNSVQIPIEHNAENRTNVELTRDRRYKRLTNREIKYLFVILLFIMLTTITTILAIHYAKPKTEGFSVAATIASTFTSTWIPTSTLTSPLTTATTSTSTSTLTTAATSTSTLTTAVTSTSTSTLTTAATSTSTSNLTTAATSTLTTATTSTSTSVSTSTSTPEILCATAEWDPNGITVVSDLYLPSDVAIDSEDNLIIADSENHRLQKYFSNGTSATIVKSAKVSSVFIDKFDNIYFTNVFRDAVDKLNSNDGLVTVVAGDNGPGSALDQLKFSGEPSIYVDKNSTLYISDTGNHRVIKYYENSTSGIIVAGGHGQGPGSNQLNGPYGIYVDEIDEIGAIYICDTFNHRIQKWLLGAFQGITVASNDDQLHSPHSIVLVPTSDQSMIMYISNFDHEQIVRWIPYAGTVDTAVAGDGIGTGTEPSKLFGPRGFKFDKNWNLFVADNGNNRIQKFLFNTSSCTNNN